MTVKLAVILELKGNEWKEFAYKRGCYSCYWLIATEADGGQGKDLCRKLR